MKKAIAIVLVMALSLLIFMRVGFAKTIYESESDIAMECVEAIGSRLVFFDLVMEEFAYMMRQPKIRNAIHGRCRNGSSRIYNTCDFQVRLSGRTECSTRSWCSPHMK